MAVPCRYRWLAHEGMTERGLEPCGDCVACVEEEGTAASTPPSAGPAPSRRRARPTTTAPDADAAPAATGADDAPGSGGGD